MPMRQWDPIILQARCESLAIRLNDWRYLRVMPDTPRLSLKSDLTLAMTHRP